MHLSRRRYILAAAVGAMLARSPVWGAISASWIAPVDGSWTLLSAWSSNPAYPNNGQPNPSDLYAAIIVATGAPYTVSLASDITISSLTLNSSYATLSHTTGTLK